MPYTRARELLRQAVVAVDKQPDDFGLHSLRAGAATTAATATASLSIRLIKNKGVGK